MKRCVANFKNGFLNVPADRLEREDAIIFVYNGEKLVAMFDIGMLDSIWITEVKDNQLSVK